MTTKLTWTRRALCRAATTTGLCLLGAGAVAAQGLTYSRGQSVSPAYEGWTQNDDGSYNFVFGYLNRNWEEEPNIPVGPDNGFSPGAADRGQPTYFLPRRNRFIFEVTVPADWGDKELVWTVKANGEEKIAIASLRPDYFIDNVVVMSETGALGAGSSTPELRAQEAPQVELETPREISVQVGQPVRLVAKVSDDGLPEPDGGRLPVTEEGLLALGRVRPPSRITVDKANGLYMSWFVYRAPEDADATTSVVFDPPQVHPWEDTRPYSNSPWAPGWIPPKAPEDGRWVTEVTFDHPGTYILRGRADDGGLYADEEVTVLVRRPVS